VLASRGVRCEPSTLTAERIAQRLSQMLSSTEWSVVSEFLAGIDAVEERAVEPDDSTVPERLRGAREAYVGALLAGQRSAALTVAEQCLQEGFSIADIYVEVVAAALHRVGYLWETNRISVAHEHIATAITQMVIASLYPRITRSDSPRGRAVVTGVAGEMHQVGANLLADALEAKGWIITFLGSDVPTRALLDTVEGVNPDLLCVSTTLAIHLPFAAEVIHKVRERFGPERPEILVGGAAFKQAPATYIQELGVRRTDLRGALNLFCPET
jgi:MerR family transcriptional regulator, light-induced transcriptional regulator